MNLKMILLNLIPFAIIFVAILLFIEPAEQPVLLTFSFAFALLWAIVVYSIEAGQIAIIAILRRLFSRVWASKEARRRKRLIDEVKPVKSDGKDPENRFP
ncbi:MAG: hypothetical protein ACYTHM_19335 [Planctomycetota bacterium]|jgi:predicted membrane protein